MAIKFKLEDIRAPSRVLCFTCLQFCAVQVYSSVLYMSTVLCCTCLQFCAVPVYSSLLYLSTVLCCTCLQFCAVTAIQQDVTIHHLLLSFTGFVVSKSVLIWKWGQKCWWLTVQEEM